MDTPSTKIGINQSKTEERNHVHADRDAKREISKVTNIETKFYYFRRKESEYIEVSQRSEETD